MAYKTERGLRSLVSFVAPIHLVHLTINESLSTSTLSPA